MYVLSSSGSWAFACVKIWFGLSSVNLAFLYMASLHLAMVIAFSSGWGLCGSFISGLSMFLEVCSIAVHLTASSLFTQRHISLSVVSFFFCVHETFKAELLPSTLCCNNFHSTIISDFFSLNDYRFSVILYIL